MRIDEEKAVKETNQEKDIDLNLSLSLNGKFGVDPQRNHIVSGASSHSKVSITPNKRSWWDYDENGAESKMWHSVPAGTEMKEMLIGRKKSQSLALLDANKSSSLVSQGSNSPPISYLQRQTIEGQGLPTNVGCPNEKNHGKCVETVAENTSLKAVPADMPQVFTIVHGQKIEGFLSRYDEEDNISIICTCHGCSMSPVEFIKHAGGGDVANPYRLIRINSALGGVYGVNPLN